VDEDVFPLLTAIDEILLKKRRNVGGCHVVDDHVEELGLALTQQFTNSVRDIQVAPMLVCERDVSSIQFDMGVATEVEQRNSSPPVV
jgi:hypothetical protein